MDRNKIISELERIPQEIRNCGLTYLERRDLAEKEKLSLNVAIATATLKADRPNATEKKAYAVIATKEYHKKYLAAQLEEEKAKIELEYVENQYITARKLASIEEKNIIPNSSGF